MIENVAIHHKDMEILATSVDEDTRIDSFSAVNKEIFFFPKGIDKFSTDLVNLVVRNCKLREINSKNLEKFNLLQYLDLSHNQIIRLGENLFSNGPTILYIILSDNKIKYVHYSVFKIRGHIYLDLENNYCINELQSDSIKIKNLIELVRLQCRSTESSTESQNTETISSNFQENVTNMTEKVIIKSSGESDSSMYLIFLLIGLILVSIGVGMFFKNYYRRSPMFDDNQSKSVSNTNKNAHIPSHGIAYESQASYEEVNYDGSQQNQTSEIGDFYVEFNANNVIIEPELYADVYKPRNE
jgi:hypothetical protein